MNTAALCIIYKVNTRSYLTKVKRSQCCWSGALVCANMRASDWQRSDFGVPASIRTHTTIRQTVRIIDTY